MTYKKGDILALRGAGHPVFYLSPNLGWDDKHNAALGEDSSFRYIAEGFFEAGAELAAACHAGGGKLDFKFYPLLYLYRHGIELGLKQLYRWRCELLGERLEPGKPTGHPYLKLWEAVHPLLEGWVADAQGIAIRRPHYSVQEADALLRDIDALDPGGFSFRYPKSQKGRPLLGSVEAVSVQTVHDALVPLGHTFEAWMAAAQHTVELERFALGERKRRKEPR